MQAERAADNKVKQISWTISCDGFGWWTWLDQNAVESSEPESQDCPNDLEQFDLIRSDDQRSHDTTCIHLLAQVFRAEERFEAFLAAAPDSSPD